MNSRRLSSWALLAILSLLAVTFSACGGGEDPPAEETPAVSQLGEVQLNAHPQSLDGKTVVLRWNGKPNGDHFLTRVGELLTERFPSIELVKLWEVEPDTATTSDAWDVSDQITAKVMAQNPDMVIASQCD